MKKVFHLNELIEEKNYLRKHFREIRSKLPQKRKNEAKEALLEHLKEKLILYKKVLSFSSLLEEIDLSLVNQSLLDQGKLHLSRIENNELVPYKVTDLQSQLEIHKHKFLQPNANKCEKEECLDLILVPAVAFDKRGGRLGLGKGYYDQFLSKYLNCLTIGVGYREQFSDSMLPCEPHDIKVRELCLV